VANLNEIMSLSMSLFFFTEQMQPTTAVFTNNFSDHNGTSAEVAQANRSSTPSKSTSPNFILLARKKIVIFQIWG